MLRLYLTIKQKTESQILKNEKILNNKLGLFSKIISNIKNFKRSKRTKKNAFKSIKKVEFIRFLIVGLFSAMLKLIF